jgi:hypothetical protein
MEMSGFLHDKKAIIEQLHASLKLGPVTILIDGLSELETKNNLQLDIWLPIQLEPNCKFIFTLNSSSTIYDDMMRTRNNQTLKYDINTFETDDDYIMFFAKLLKLEASKLFSVTNKKVYQIPIEMLSFKDQNSQNNLYEKALKSLPDLKTARHFSNPLYCQLIAQELFSYDKDIFEMHPLGVSQQANELRYSVSQDYENGKITSHRGSIKRRGSISVASAGSLSVFNSYIEEVCTIRELVQKIIKRYILKYSWTTNEATQVSVGMFTKTLIKIN